MKGALGRFSSLVRRQASSSLGVRGFQVTEAAAAPIPIDSEPYCRQRNELVLGNRIPVKAPDAWVAPTAVIIGDVDLYERVGYHVDVKCNVVATCRWKMKSLNVQQRIGVLLGVCLVWGSSQRRFECYKSGLFQQHTGPDCCACGQVGWGAGSASVVEITKFVL